MLNTNDDFAGFMEEDINDVDFFSIEDDTTPPADDIENPTPEDASKEKEEQKQEENLFDSVEEEEDEDTSLSPEASDEDDAAADTPEGDAITALSLLEKKGFVEYELEEGETLTNEKAGEILEDSFDNMLEKRIEDLFSEVPEVVREMNKFVLKGGDINEFLDKVAQQNTAGISSDLDMDEEANQELVARHGLKEEGYDEEYIAAQIEFLKDSKNLKKISAKHYKKWNTKRSAEQNAILASKEAAAKQAKIQRRELKGKVSTFLKDTDEVTGFTVTPKDRKALPDYMSDRTIRLDNGSQVTGMQRDLMRVLNSPTGSVQMAKLLKAASQEGELSFDEIKKATETKVAKKVKDNVRRNKSITSQSGGKKTRPLADYFND
tara:strand:- start:13891 stop:15024 length:1134 start_codon:yes stop_codon:yes gene_type:complete